MTPDFKYAVDDGVAQVTFDMEGESVNTLTAGVARQFEEILDRAAADAAVRAVVFCSAKKDFIVGAKLDALATIGSVAEGTAASRKAQQGMDRLDAFPKPVVAAIDGNCLGGGLEWALACDYRVASDGPRTSLGLPEVQVGLIPGAGGTQRLPRLIGLQAAVELILAGKAVKARKALKLGMVDEVVPPSILVELACRRARELAVGTLVPDRARGLSTVPRQKSLSAILQGLVNSEAWAELALEDNPIGRRLLFDQAHKALLKKTKGKYPAPERALEAIRVGAEKGQQAGLEAEAQAFGELVMSDVSRRLVEIFFATTQLKKDNGVADPQVQPRPVTKLGLLGGGLMGGGIAFVTANQLPGVGVRLKERDDASVARALQAVRALYDEKVKRRSLTQREADRQLAQVTAGTTFAGFKRAEVVIEAVFEDLGLKQQLLREVEAVGRPDVIFASNTSSLPITRIAQASRHPETVIGMHYFSPVNKMPLLEIINHPGTAPWVTATCVELGKRQGKTVIVVNDGVGFYTSRALAPYMNEAAYLLAEGAEVVELDRALTDFGFPVGPITLLDEVGIDVAHKVGKIMQEAFGERIRAPASMDALVADGRLGRKAQKGFFRYEKGKKLDVDETVYALLPHGRERKRLDRFEMAERCVLQMVNEAARCLGEGVLRSPRDGDIGAIFGLGFPPFLGGPFRHAEALGLARVVARLEHYQERHGDRFAPAPALVEAARSGQRFYR